MPNKFLYALSKDSIFRILLLLILLVAAGCVIVLRLKTAQQKQLQEVRAQQALAARIPDLETKISTMARAVQGYVLNGIITLEPQPMAIVNNVVVKEGDDLDGRKVVAISAENVTICNYGMDKCFHLKLE